MEKKMQKSIEGLMESYVDGATHSSRFQKDYRESVNQNEVIGYLSFGFTINLKDKSLESKAKIPLEILSDESIWSKTIGEDGKSIDGYFGISDSSKAHTIIDNKSMEIRNKLQKEGVPLDYSISFIPRSQDESQNKQRKETLANKSRLKGTHFHDYERP